ncbi:hypothetical protein NA57DRAFT_70084 [Rhizodiscina lignyota]|uniref:Uncharacterized protein n=1 Tax=Rhizodiscina lignyota TaxID=1504668 RepID=A0A9P4IR70_9PEZI|nr:hypothetical protein NA57DRAFT_70084 [Rhizodiscina lignyota]
MSKATAMGNSGSSEPATESGRQRDHERYLLGMGISTLQLQTCDSNLEKLFAEEHAHGRHDASRETLHQIFEAYYPFRGLLKLEADRNDIERNETANVDQERWFVKLNVCPGGKNTPGGCLEVLSGGVEPTLCEAWTSFRHKVLEVAIPKPEPEKSILEETGYDRWDPGRCGL